VDTIDVQPGMEALARRGARACPERIIKVEEDAGADQAKPVQP
jgi:ferredoxin